MTTFTSSVECVEYRIALIRPASQGVLVIGEDNESRLLRVSLPVEVRPVPQLRRILETRWGMHGLVLDYLPSQSTASLCAVVELFSEESPTSAFRAVPVDEIAEDDMSESERTVVLALLDGRSCGPFSRQEWIDDAIAWVEDATRQRLSSKLEIEQYNAGDAFTLTRFPMRSGQSFWLKATGEPNAHELPIATLLSRLSPQHVPPIVAVNPTCNAWIMPDEGVALLAYRSESTCHLHLLVQAVTAMAEVQLKTSGHESELLSIGAFDQRVTTLRDNSQLLFERIDEAMSLQTSNRVPRIGKRQLDELHKVFDTTCSVMEELAVPATVLHGDMNAANILYRDDRCVFIDWCETFLGFPFITLQHLLLLNQQTEPHFRNSSDQILIDCYREVMKTVCDQSTMDRAIACMPLLAAASAIYGRGDWLQFPSCDSPHRQASIRTLARQMHRAAQSDAFLEAIAVRSHTS